MKCPSCKTSDLVATRLDDSLPVHGCNQCKGAIISLLYYRDWAERTVNDKQPTDIKQEVQLAEKNDSHSALTCPKCAKLMTKYNISGYAKNRLDLCSSCDEAWLDGGEWELLKALQLSTNIPTIFTDPWQRRVRHERNEKNLKERFTKIVGDADIKKAEEIRSWLKSHKNRSDILFYLSQE